MLEVQGLSGGWGATTVVEDLSLSVAPGETLAIVGRNGVGKTTLLEVIIGRARRNAGEILLDGKSLSRRPTHQRSKAGIGYVPQRREIFPSLTVRENLLIGRRPGVWTEKRVFELFPSLVERASNLGTQLSGGEQQMLSIGRALLANPHVLIMDEPVEGLAPVVIDQLVGALRTVMADRSLAVLMVEQRVDVALELSTTCMVMDHGRFVFSAPSEELRATPSRLAGLLGFAEDGSS
jgi:branched-chain amino acid transport system ATP-binding protein